MTLSVVEFLLSGFTDNSDNALAGGKVYTYSPGTTTLKSTYTDKDGVTPEANPIILDSNGRKQVYASGAYKFVIKTSADVTLYTLDNLYFDLDTPTSHADISSLNSAGKEIVIKTAISLTADLTLTAPLKILKGGSINTNGHTLTINGPFSAGCTTCFTTASGLVLFGVGSCSYILPEWFGAVGDGSTDDSTAFNIAFNSVPSSHIAIKVQNGRTYRAGGLTLPERTTILGSRVYNSSPTIKYIGSSGYMFKLSSAGVESFNVIKNVILHGNSATVSIVDNNGAQYSVFEEVYFVNGSLGLDHTDVAYFTKIKNCLFVGTTVGIKLSAGCNYVSIIDSIFQGAQTYSIQCDSSFTGDMIIVRNCEFGPTSCTDCIKVEVSAGYQGRTMLIDGCRFDASPSDAQISIGNLATASIVNCSCAGSSTNLIKIDGVDCFVANNAFFSSAGAAIALLSNSARTFIGRQRWGEGGSACASRLTDTGTENGNFKGIVKKSGVTVGISNNNAETTIATYTIPADALELNRAVKMTVLGSIFNNTGSGNGSTIKCKLAGTTVITDATMTSQASHASDYTTCELEFTVQANNSQSAQTCSYSNSNNRGALGTASSGNLVKGGKAGAADNTSDVTMSMTQQLSAASASLDWTTSGYWVEFI